MLGDLIINCDNVVTGFLEAHSRLITLRGSSKQNKHLVSQRLVIKTCMEIYKVSSKLQCSSEWVIITDIDNTYLKIQWKTNKKSCTK